MEGTRKPMPVGVEDFKELVSEDYFFIDKTGFIRDYIDAKGKVTLITRPRRFGKTLTLSMLQYFFTAEHAVENRKLFAGLDIERAGERYMREQGSLPVVFLSLKDVQRPNYASMLAMLSLLLQEVYDHYVELPHPDKAKGTQAPYYRRILAGEGTEEDLVISLKRLMEYMEKQCGQKPLLLLDEYDAPILSAWENGYYKECIAFMRGFLSAALKTNPSLGSAVLTGVTRISKESIFSGLNHLNVCSVLTEKYSDAFGFTQEEAARLMEDCGVGDKLPELKRWYDGYLIGGTEIYNPWSVIQFVDHGCKFRPYWLNTSGNAILRDLLARVDSRRQRDLCGLLHGKPVEAPAMENFVFGDIRSSRDALLMLLMTTGYLKPVEMWKDENDTDWVRLQIPNMEVRTAYHSEILNHIVPSQGETLLRDMLRSMAEGDTEGFSESLSDILRDFVSYHDAAQPESFYHGLLLGFSVLMDGKYRVASNKESGYGRFDLAFFPLKENTPGVILEIKAAKSEDELEAKAKEALSQIGEKAYGAEMKRQGVDDVWRYGIAFCRKRVWMAGE
ncbi:MAG: AAA family ATPase [Selenomonadaceae bacterium]|nr:AAA family ATPase [Selenomonadaceae bacterium]